jgi:hypothetical protein
LSVTKSVLSGGSEGTLLEDMDQSGLMWRLRVKIDAWSHGLDESLRQRNRLLLIESYLRLPPCRVWLFVKRIRVAFLERSKGFETEIDFGDCFQGPENTIARGKLSTVYLMQNVLTKIASHIIKPERLAQLIYKATMNDLKLKEKPEINLWAKISTLDMHGFRQISLLRLLASSEPRMLPYVFNRVSLISNIGIEYIRGCGKLVRSLLK